MGYHSIWTSDPLQNIHRTIAVGQIRQKLGNWQPGHGRKHPDVRVEMISNLSAMYRRVEIGWWGRWKQKFGIG